MKNSIKATSFLLVILIVTILSIYTASAENGKVVLINEIMSSNTSTLTDEAGEYYDWIELYNAGDAVVNLGGYGLSDNNLYPYKWVSPDITLEPHNYLVVFASDKNTIALGEKIGRLIIDQGHEWRYKVWTSEPPPEWRNLEFDDSDWGYGPSGFGYGDGDDATVLPGAPVSVHIRKNFVLSDLNDIAGALLQMDYDDGFVAYLNGVEIARDNIGIKDVPVPYNKFADFHTEAKLIQELPLVNFPVENALSILRTGENVLAVQGHNTGNSADLSLIPFLALTEKRLFLHTNFKIKSSGETVILINSDGNICDRVETERIPADISRGRQPDGGTEWVFFPQPTPGESNITTGFQGFSDSVLISHSGGFYNNSISVTLSVNSPETVIHYTLDGNYPEENSPIYSDPIPIDSTTVVKARAFEEGLLPGRIITNTYFINEHSTLPVISLSTPSANFFDSKIGIYANFQQKWERPVHVEFYEPDGRLGFSMDVGMKIVGWASRGFPQKSLAIFARGRYGDDVINYQIFPDMPINEFHSLVLRNSGNNWELTHFRDALMQSLVKDLDLDIQAYRPAVVFINGEYWGIYNIREKQNEDYLASHHGIDPDNVDIMEFYSYAPNIVAIEGDDEHYNAMIDFISNHDMHVSANYEYIKTQIDVNNFIDYMVAEIYYANWDWPCHNLKFWRPRTLDGKWRWLMFDIECGFGNNSPDAYQKNTLAVATAPDGNWWPNPPWSTFLLRKLLENQTFRNDFINRFTDYLNTIFSPRQVIQRVYEIKAMIEPEMPNHLSKWELGSIQSWKSQIQVLIFFANNRVSNVRSHIQSKFNLRGMAKVAIDISQTDAGKIKINSRTIEEYPWDGQYFKDIPLQLNALPNPGYKFAGWTGISPTDSISTTIVLSESIAVTALFEQDEGPFGPIVINEINYNSSDTFNPDDWIELYNNSGSSVDLSGWRCMDEDDTHFYDLPPGTVIGAGQFLVLCRDSQAFTSFFPLVDNYIGDLGFGLSGGGELIRLLDSQGTIIDSLTFDDAAPWPVEPDGNGPTLALTNPDTNNSIPLNWAASLYHGTPGKVNDVISGVDEVLHDVPRQFSLDQNFPNPFNPFTAICFGLPRECNVTIEVFNILGQRVATLQKGYKSAGYHTVHFNGSVVSSGVYYYRMKAGAFNSVKKMLLVK